MKKKDLIALMASIIYTYSGNGHEAFDEKKCVANAEKIYKLAHKVQKA